MSQVVDYPFLTPDALNAVADESLRFFFESSPLLMGTVALLPDGDLLHLRDNPATCRFFGLEPASTNGRTARALGMPETIIQSWRGHYEQSAAAAAPVRFEYWHRHAGANVCLHVTVAPLTLQAPGGEPCFSYVAQDVTEARMAERTLLATEASVQMGLAAGQTVTWELDPTNGRINRSANAESFLGPGDSLDDFRNRLPRAHLEEMERLIADVVEGRRDSYDHEYQYSHSDGRVLWLHNRARVQRGADGKAIRIHGVAIEVTQRREAEEALQRARERLQLATKASGLGIWEWNLETGEIHHSERAREIYGLEPSRAVTYDDLVTFTHPDDLPLVQEMTGRARDPNVRASPVFEYRLMHPAGAIRWARVHGQAVFEDAPSGSRAVRYIGTLEDVTERRQLEERLKASEARLRLALNASRMAVFDWRLADPEPDLTPELRAQLKLGEDEPSSVQDRRRNYHPEDAAIATRTRERALSGDERFIDFEFRYFWPDGQVRWFQVRSEVLRDKSGTPERLVGVQVDVTERRADEERLRLLAREVDHRANNLLTVVQSIVSLSSADDIDGLRDVLLGRISALARTHRALANNGWAGADLLDLLSDELIPFGLEAGQVQLSGDESCILSPAQAQALALAIHELATNAAKYGALSVRNASVAIKWTIADRVLTVDWEEQGGPPVRVPRRRGFGTTLLQRTLAGALGGSAALEWRVSGVRCRLILPLAAMS